MPLSLLQRHLPLVLRSPFPALFIALSPGARVYIYSTTMTATGLRQLASFTSRPLLPQNTGKG